MAYVLPLFFFCGFSLLASLPLWLALLAGSLVCTALVASFGCCWLEVCSSLMPFPRLWLYWLASRNVSPVACIS